MTQSVPTVITAYNIDLYINSLPPGQRCHAVLVEGRRLYEERKLGYLKNPSPEEFENLENIRRAIETLEVE